jgi:hypothetical protein
MQKLDQTREMGFNPNRPHKAKKADLPLVLIALAIVLALTAWGLFG